jgi:hypothetical protein
MHGGQRDDRGKEQTNARFAHGPPDVGSLELRILERFS